MSFGVSSTNSNFNQQGTSATQNQGTTAASGTASSAPVFSGAQTGLQAQLAQALTAILQGNGYSPQVQALQTQSADQINKDSSSVSDRMNKFLAARGFGSSGTSGQVQLGTELNRQSNLANNNANFASLALGQWGTALADALTMAYAAPGTASQFAQGGSTASTSNTQTTQKGNSSSTQVGGGVSAGIAFGG